VEGCEESLISVNRVNFLLITVLYVIDSGIIRSISVIFILQKSIPTYVTCTYSLISDMVGTVRYHPTGTVPIDM
jgi:hypothetical protein